jgi:hypothetical protein
MLHVPDPDFLVLIKEQNNKTLKNVGAAGLMQQRHVCSKTADVGPWHPMGTSVSMPRP